MPKDDGGAAFPISREQEGWYREGMTLRDYLAAHAPVGATMALAVWGKDSQLAGPPADDKARAAFMAVWALLRYEYADAMLAERKESADG